VVHDAYAQGGVFRMGVSAQSPIAAAQALESARGVLRALSTAAPTTDELENAKRQINAALNNSAQGGGSVPDAWLDEQTYQLDTAGGTTSMRAINSLTPADVQRVAARLFLNTPVATVVVGSAGKLRTELARVGGVEIYGETAMPPTTQPKPADAKAQQPNAPLQLKRP
ncbi:MAG: hypothetical protein WCD76_02000, partial [Pyrinomonadaceae bacterium]